MPETQLSLAPGEIGAAAITARATKRPWVLNERVVPMELRAQTETATIIKTAQVIVPPRIPLAALLLLGLPLLAVVFFAGRGVLCRQEITRLTNTRYDRLCGLLPEEVPVAEVTHTNTPTTSPQAAAIPAPTTIAVSTLTVTASAQPTVTCEGASPTRLTVGGMAQVINDNINVRSEPRVVQEPSNRICEMRPGRVVDVLRGPECDGEGQLWYFVRSQEPVVCTVGEDRVITEGWVAEESGATYLLEPVE